MQVLSVNNVSFKYPHSDKKAVDNVSLKIEKGSYTAIIGNNGSGKSTLARIICNLEDAESGTVEIDKDALIGLIFQNPKNQIISGVVCRDTAIGPQNLGLDKAETELRTIESLNIVDMLDRAESSTMALSLGQTQKIALSGIIALRPNLLILDEPMSMIDPESRKEIYEFLNYWHKQGNTIVHITHDKDAIEQAENIVQMVNGRVTFDGKKSEFVPADEIALPKRRTQIREGSLGETETPIRSGSSGVADKQIALAFQNVDFSYGEKSVLQDISFSIPMGSLVAITGPSGCGKSTILELAAGLLKPTTDEIAKKKSNSNRKLTTDDVTANPNGEIKTGDDNSNLDRGAGGIFASGKIALCQQNAAGALFETFAADDVAVGPRNLGKKGKELVKIVKDSMNKASLPYEEFGERCSFELSGGEQRRLAIAGILALDTSIILFDEPTAGLDEPSRVSVLQMMRDLADEGKTVMFSTHKMDETEIADMEIKIRDGKIISDEKKIVNQEIDLGTENGNSNTGREIETGNMNSSASVQFGAGAKIEPLPSAKTLEGLRKVSTAFNTKTAKKSFISKWHPLLKLLVFLAIFITSIATRKIWLCGSMLVVSVLYCALAKFSMKKLLIMILTVTPFLLIFTALQLWLKQSIWFCIATYLRTIAAISAISGFYYSTPDYDLIDGISYLLKPLTLIKIPVRYLILVIEIMFRFIPLLIDEAASIIKTQSIRGGLGTAKGFKKVRAMIPLFVPLFAQTIKRAEALADALTVRCFR